MKKKRCFGFFLTSLLFTLSPDVFVPLGAAFGQSDRGVVTVNGAPITEKEVFERLWRAYGPGTLDAMIDDLLLRQAAAARKMKVSPAEVEAAFKRMRFEHSRVAAGLQPGRQSTEVAPGVPVELTPALKEELGQDLAVEKLLIEDLRLSVTDQEVKDAFATHKDELGLPELVHLQVILVADGPKAQKLARDIQNGADFSFLARKESMDPAASGNGGDWGFVAVPELIPALAQAVGAMKLGEARAIQGPNNWFVVQILENRPASPAEFGQVKDQLRHALTERKIQAALPHYLQDLRAKAQIVPQGP